MSVTYEAVKKQFPRGGNCALEATWQVRCDLSIEAITEAYKATGKYTKRGGVRFGAWDEVFEAFGIQTRRVNTHKKSYTAKFMTVSQFARANPVGVFYILIRGHALAIINGRVVDPNLTSGGGKPKMKARVIEALMIVNPVTQYTHYNF